MSYVDFSELVYEVNDIFVVLNTNSTKKFYLQIDWLTSCLNYYQYFLYYQTVNNV